MTVSASRPYSTVGTPLATDALKSRAPSRWTASPSSRARPVTAASSSGGQTVPPDDQIMADLVDGYAKAAADVETDLEELEVQVFSESTPEDHRRIYEIRKDIGRIDRAVSSIAAALRESTRRLEATKVGREEIVPYLHDLLDDAAGTAALINNQSRALDAILSSHENNVAARQNKDMRTISAFAALLALPTLIAGVYGMNFKNLPLVQWQFGWIAIEPASESYSSELELDSAARELLDLYLSLCVGRASARFVLAHVGQSLDGQIATSTGASRDVTGPANIRHMHRLRALCDAVLVGACTVERDDPQLTTRHVAGPNPVRVVIDPTGRMPPALTLLSDGAAPVICITAEGARPPAGAEGLALMPGAAIVSYEQNHRVDVYSDPGFETSGPKGSYAIPYPRGEIRINRGFETIAVAPEDGPLAGAPVIVAERSLDAQGNMMAAILDGPLKGTFSVVRNDPYDATDGSFLPNGDLLLLERRFRLSDGVGMRIRRIKAEDIRPGAVVAGEVLIDADMSHQIDNMEGLDILQLPDGDIRIVVVSDDNHSILQRNLMLEFRLTGGL